MQYICMYVCMYVHYTYCIYICSSANLISYFGPCKSHLLPPASKTDDDCHENVWLVPGGSSGGSAVAVATKMCDL